MTENREGFVVWIDIADRGNHALRGAVEWTRSAQRIEFSSAAELEGFLERCIKTRDETETPDNSRRQEAILPGSFSKNPGT